MSSAKVEFTVFTKPWKTPLPELGRFVAGLGFDGVELPVRPGFQVEPAAVARGLPEAVRVLADHGVRIASIAGPTDEKTIAACAAAGVPIIRICCFIPDRTEYLAGEAEIQRHFDQLLPLLEKHGVTIGVQNHCGRSVLTAMDLRHLIAKYDPRHVAAVLDFGHCGLAGQAPDLALDIVWPHLRLVNFKSAYWRRAEGPPAGAPRWESCWTGGREGMADWPAAVGELKKRGYQGDVCLTAEYSDKARLNQLIAEDFPVFARFAASV